MKIINSIMLIVIAVCLVYISFLKPLPNRYERKVINEETKDLVSRRSVEGYEIFDTATGKVYRQTETLAMTYNRDGSASSAINIFERLVADIVGNSVTLLPLPKWNRIEGFGEANYVHNLDMK